MAVSEEVNEDGLLPEWEHLTLPEGYSDPLFDSVLATSKTLSNAVLDRQGDIITDRILRLEKENAKEMASLSPETNARVAEISKMVVLMFSLAYEKGLRQGRAEAAQASGR